MRTSTPPYLRVVACTGPVVFVAGLAALHAIQPDLIHTSTISKYALGPAGWLLQAAFLAAGTGYGALAALRRGRPGARLLTGTVAGFVLMGLFRIDAVGPEQIVSVAGALHTLGFALTILLVHPAMWRVTRHLDGPARPLRRAATVIAPPLFIAGFLLPDLAGGIAFRLWMATLLLWSICTTLVLPPRTSAAPVGRTAGLAVARGTAQGAP
jgi:hypothetical protein